MAKVDGDEVELTERDASVIKGMLARGDNQHHVAAWFGVDSRAVSHVNQGRTFPHAPAAKIGDLPPPGPYRPDTIFVAFYKQMAEVNDLWQKRELKRAKALLETALKSPMLPISRSSMDYAADDMFRDDFGIVDL